MGQPLHQLPPSERADAGAASQHEVESPKYDQADVATVGLFTVRSEQGVAAND